MSEVGVLASLKMNELRNRMRLFRKRGRFKTAVILVFSIAFWVSLFQIFHYAMRFLRDIGYEQFHENLIQSMFHIFFFALTLMLIFSNAIIGYGSYFKSKETGFLFSMPVRSESIFLYKFTECLAFSSWAFLFLGTPLMAAYAAAFDLGIGFFFMSIPFFFVYLFIPAGVGAIIAMLVTVYVPRTRKGLVVAVAAAAGILLMIAIAKFLSFRGGFSQSVKMAQEAIRSVKWSENPLLPSSWVAQGILQLGSKNWESAGFYFVLIVANSLFFCVVAHVMSTHMLPKGWFISQSLRRVKRFKARGFIDQFFGRLLFFVSRPVRLIVVKDVKSFIRDPVQWSQFLIFFGLLGIYFLNLKTFAYEERSIEFKNLIAQMNLLATSLTLATFASRFIFPQLSLEGRRFWVIGMVPIDREKILFGKLALSFTTAMLISETLIMISSYMLQTPITLAVLHMVALFGICLGISGMAVGLGAVYPNFSEDSPSKIVAGFGGTLNLVISLIFVLAVLLIQAIPCFLYYSRAMAIDPKLFRTLIVISMISIAGVSLLACLVPMAMGLRAIKKLEV